MKLIYLIILALIVGACSSRIGEIYLAPYSKLNLKPDSTFYYEYQLGWHYFYSEGKWQRLKDNIVLKGKYQDLNSIPVEVEEYYYKNQENTIFEILLRNTILKNDSKTYQYAVKKGNGDSFYSSTNVININKSFREDSFQITISKSDSNQIPFNIRHIISTEKYIVQNKNSNYYKVIIPVDENVFNYDNLQCDTLKIKWNKLRCTNIKKTFYYLKKK